MVRFAPVWVALWLESVPAAVQLAPRALAPAPRLLGRRATRTSAEPPSAAVPLATLRASWRVCAPDFVPAISALWLKNPDAAGNITLTIRVGAGGEVTGVSGSSGSLPASVVACVKARAQAAQFDAPDGGSAVISVPVTFVKQ